MYIYVWYVLFHLSASCSCFSFTSFYFFTPCFCLCHLRSNYLFFPFSFSAPSGSHISFLPAGSSLFQSIPLPYSISLRFSVVLCAFAKLRKQLSASSCLSARPHGKTHLSLGQCFSTSVTPRLGNFFFFIRRGPGPNKSTCKCLYIFLNWYFNPYPANVENMVSSL